MERSYYVEFVIRIITFMYILRIYLKSRHEYKYKKRSENVKAVIDIFFYAILGVSISLVLSILALYQDIDISKSYHYLNVIWHVINIIAVNYSLRFVYIIFPEHPKQFLQQTVHGITSILIGIAIGTLFYPHTEFISMNMGLLILFSSAIVVIYSKKSYKYIMKLRQSDTSVGIQNNNATKELQLRLYFLGSLFFIVFLLMTLIFMDNEIISQNATYIGQIINAHYTYKSFFNKTELEKRLFFRKNYGMKKFFNMPEKHIGIKNISFTEQMIKKTRNLQIINNI